MKKIIREIILFLLKLPMLLCVLLFDFLISDNSKDEDETEENKDLAFELRKRKGEILRANREEILSKMIPTIQKLVYADENIILTDNEARDIALDFFIEMKKKGEIDIMNRIREEVEG